MEDGGDRTGTRGPRPWQFDARSIALQMALVTAAAALAGHVVTDLFHGHRIHVDEWAPAAGISALLAAAGAFAAAGLITRWQRRAISEPVRALRIATERRAMGDELSFAPTSLPGDLGRLATAINEMIRSAEESESRFRELAEHAGDVFWIWEIGAPGRFVYVSPAHDALFGRSRDGLYTGSESLLDLAHPDDAFRTGLAEGLTRPGFDAELRILRPDGEARRVRIRTYPVRDAAGALVRLAGVASDETQTHQAREHERVRATLVRLLADVGAALSAEGDTPSALRACARSAVWDLGAEDAAFWLWDERAVALQPVASAGRGTDVAGEDAGAGGAELLIRQVADDRVSRCETRVGLDGLERELCAWPLATRDRLIGVFAIVLSRKLGELEHREIAHVADVIALGVQRRRIEEELVQARDAAESANHAKSEFLANMSHELRTPLHCILSSSQLGLDRGEALTPEKRAQYFGMIHQSGATLLALINDLLDLAKLEAGRMKYEMRTGHVAEAVDLVVDEFRSLVSERGLAVEWERCDDEPAVRLDVERLRQVVRNLLSNAVKFSPPGGRITVTSYRGDGVAGVCVRDRGPGVPPDELEAVFDKFVQSSRTKTGHGGTGLGLSICREILAAHHGRVWAENHPGGGAVFRFEIPVEAES